MISFQPGAISFTKSTTVPMEPSGTFPAHQRRSLTRYEQTLYDDLRRAHHAAQRDEVKLSPCSSALG